MKAAIKFESVLKDHLSDPEQAAKYLTACYEEGPEVFLQALRDALRRFMSAVLNFTASFLLLLVTLPVVLFTMAAIWRLGCDRRTYRSYIVIAKPSRLCQIAKMSCSLGAVPPNIPERSLT